jgi:hypothetical protein
VSRLRKDLKNTQDDLVARQARPVKVRVAASMAYHELTGRKREAILARDYFLALNDIAMSLAQVADIYYLNSKRNLVRLAAEELAGGRFENGGDAFRSASGEVYRTLSMRRGEAMAAIVALKEGQAALEGARVARSPVVP